MEWLISFPHSLKIWESCSYLFTIWQRKKLDFNGLINIRKPLKKSSKNHQFLEWLVETVYSTQRVILAELQQKVLCISGRIINGSVLVGYPSKKLPTPVQNYGVIELELTGLLTNIHGFKQKLRNNYFEVIVDHKAIDYMVKSKHQPTTTRLANLLLKLMEYTFDLKYLEGNKLKVSDALSRLYIEEKHKMSNVIPLNFFLHYSDRQGRWFLLYWYQLSLVMAPILLGGFASLFYIWVSCVTCFTMRWSRELARPEQRALGGLL